MNTPQPVIDSFHFLRPEWLWLLPLVILIVWYLRRDSGGGGQWQTLIDPELLSALRIRDNSSQRGIAPWIAACGWVLAVLALAGPTWERLPEPVHRKQDAVIIALSLADSMLATDIQPSRLDRARFALRDVLAERREGLTALVVFSGDAHVVTPLTDDAATIDATLPVLDPRIMPTQGNNIEAAVAQAAELLHGAGLPQGRLLLVSDSFPDSMHDDVASALKSAGLQLSVLAVGTADGAPIASPDGGFLRNPDGSILVPITDLSEMRAGANSAGGRFEALQTGPVNVAALLPDDPFAELEQDTQDLRMFDQWLDRGPWLVLLLLPLAALGFRRGWVFCAALLILPAPDAAAFEWQDLWQRPDQQAAEALANGDSERAVSLFESDPWRGTAQYQNGDYEGAIESFGSADDAASAYNRGNALARAGRLEEALAAYDDALAKQPDMVDAEANRKLVEDLLKQQQQQQQQDGDGEQSEGDQDQQQDQQGDDSQREQKDGDSDQSGQQDQQGSSDEESSDQQDEQDSSQQNQGNGDNQRDEQSDTQPTDNPEQSEDEQDKQKQEAQSAGEPEPSDESTSDEARAHAMQEGQPNAEQQQAIEQWLRQVPDNPGELLRRKFEYEYLLKHQQAQRN